MTRDEYVAEEERLHELRVAYRAERIAQATEQIEAARRVLADERAGRAG